MHFNYCYISQAFLQKLSKSLKAAETMSNQDVNYQDGLSSGGKTFDINNEQDDTNSNIFTDPF